MRLFSKPPFSLRKDGKSERGEAELRHMAIIRIRAIEARDSWLYVQAPIGAELTGSQRQRECFQRNRHFERAFLNLEQAVHGLSDGVERDLATAMHGLRNALLKYWPSPGKAQEPLAIDEVRTWTEAIRAVTAQAEGFGLAV